jgi:hypothetical protein
MEEIITVNDLINLLKEFDGNKEIGIVVGEYSYKIESIDESIPFYEADEDDDISEEEINRRKKMVFIQADK